MRQNSNFWLLNWTWIKICIFLRRILNFRRENSNIWNIQVFWGLNYKIRFLPQFVILFLFGLLDKMVIKLTDRSNWRSSRPMHLFTSNQKQKKNGWAINHFSDGISQTDKKNLIKMQRKIIVQNIAKESIFPTTHA